MLKRVSAMMPFVHIFSSDSNAMRIGILQFKGLSVKNPLSDCFEERVRSMYPSLLLRHPAAKPRIE